MLLALLGCAAPVPVTVEVELSPTDAHAAAFTVAGGPGEVALVCAADDDVHRVSAASAPAMLLLRGLLADTTYECVATIAGASAAVEVTPPPLPDGLSLPTVTVPEDPEEVGFHLVNLAHLLDPTAEGGYFSDQYVAIFDAEGRPRWQLAGEGGGDIDTTWLGDGTLLYGGFGADASTRPAIVDLDGAVAMEAATTTDTDWEIPRSWHHDAGISADGESVWVLTLESAPDADDPDTSWEGFAIKRLDRATGETDWVWSSIDDGVASGALAPGSRYDTAPYHANAVWDVEEADGTKLYVSLRNLDQVLRIDVATRAVDLRIGLGGDLELLDVDGAPAEDAQWFFGQHDAKRIGDRLVLYDNGLGRNAYGTAPWARALVLTLDESAGTARIETSYREPDDWLAPAWGGLDRRDDGTLDLAIGHFWWYDEDAVERSALARLVPTADGGAEVTWRLDFPDREDAIYRSDTIAGCDLFAIEAYCP